MVAAVTVVAAWVSGVVGISAVSRILSHRLCFHCTGWSWGLGTSAVSGVVRFRDATTVGRGEGARLVGSSTTGGTVLQALLPSPLWLQARLRPGGWRCACRLPDAAGFSGAAGYVSGAGDLGLHTPPQFCLRCMFQSAHL